MRHPGRKRSDPLPEAHPKKRQARVAQAAFIDAFKRRGTILGACKEIGIERRMVREWRKDEEFESRFRDADEDVTETLETSAMDKALKPNGAMMNMFLLNARRPDKYRQRTSVEMTGKDGGPIRTAHDKPPIDWSKFNDSQIERLLNVPLPASNDNDAPPASPPQGTA
jgi:hypothetical protein